MDPVALSDPAAHPPTRLEHIDTLRGVAILAVVAQHVLQFAGVHPAIALGRRFAGRGTVPRRELAPAPHGAILGA